MIEEYWPWLIAKAGRKTGFRLLLNKWLIVDGFIAGVLTFGLQIDGFEFAGKALFPAASILAGMAFAWTARASTILSNRDFRDKIIAEGNPLEDYVYGFQMSIMILFGCVIYIALMSVGGFQFSLFSESVSRLSSSFFMYFVISLTIRECWSIVNFTSLLTILDNKVR